MRHSDWLLPGYAVQVKMRALYKQLFPSKTINLNLIVERPTKLPPYSGSISIHRQAESTDPVIEIRYDTSTTLLVISSVHTAGNNRKSVPAQNIFSPRSSLHGSSTGGTRRGPLTTAPGNHPQLPFPSIPNLLCDSLSHR